MSFPQLVPTSCFSDRVRHSTPQGHEHRREILFCPCPDHKRSGHRQMWQTMGWTKPIQDILSKNVEQQHRSAQFCSLGRALLKTSLLNSTKATCSRTGRPSTLLMGCSSTEARTEQRAGCDSLSTQSHGIRVQALRAHSRGKGRFGYLSSRLCLDC